MSDKLEKFIQQNREKLDTLEPKPDLWDKIQSKLPDGGPSNGPDGGNGAEGTGASSGAKAGAFIKWAAAVVTAGIVGTGIFFALQSGNDNPKPDTVLEPGTELAFKGDDLTTEGLPSLINPPAPHADVPYLTFDVNAQKGQLIRLDNGTIIDIPPHTFVDIDGKPVKGTVNLKYREFHDAADIMLSGITMKYDNGDSVGDFQTAGMNEIYGTQDGEEVFFAEGKSIGVTLASFTDEDDHRLYYLDQETGKGWTDIGVAEIVTNKKKAQDIRELPGLPELPAEPVKQGETEHVLSFTVDYEEFPEIKEYKNVQWEYQDVAQMDANQWIFGEAWSDATLKLNEAKPGLYTLELKNKRKTFSTVVKPILEGKDYEKALKKFNKKLDAYNEVKAERQEKEKWIAMQADLGRHFDVARWGAYNCDRLLIANGRINPKTKIVLVDNPEIDIKDLTVFHMTGRMRACLEYKGQGLERMPFSFLEPNALVAVLPGQKFAAFTPDDFDSLDESLIKQQEKVTFTLHTLPGDINTPDELRTALGI